MDYKNCREGDSRESMSLMASIRLAFLHFINSNGAELRARGAQHLFQFVRKFSLELRREKSPSHRRGTKKKKRKEEIWGKVWTAQSFRFQAFSSFLEWISFRKKAKEKIKWNKKLQNIFSRLFLLSAFLGNGSQSWGKNRCRKSLDEIPRKEEIVTKFYLLFRHIAHRMVKLKWKTFLDSTTTGP